MARERARQEQELIEQRRQRAQNDSNNSDIVIELDLLRKLKNVKELHNQSESKKYLKSLIGTIGADPLYRK